MKIKFSFIRSEFHDLKKCKVIDFLLFKIKFRVKNFKKIKTFILMQRPQPLPNFNNEPLRKKVYLSIVAIYKNEPDIVEWIEYHKLAGVERFYLYDNESTHDFEIQKFLPKLKEAMSIKETIK